MTDLKTRRVAIIGGAGFIGHNLALALKARGAHVEVIDGLEVNHLVHYASLPISEPNRNLYLTMLLERLRLLDEAGVQLRRQDARDYHGLSRQLGEIEPDTIVHLAAVAHANRSNKDPFSTFDHSMRTLENALDWGRASNLHRFIFFSSSMVYGNFMTESVSEDHPLDPIGIYGALKLGGEKLVIAYNQVFDMPYTIVRPSALYGPRCVSRRVSQAFIESALVGDTLRIDGEGDEKVDFTHIDDVVEGVIRCIEHDGARNETFNMTAGKGRSLRDLVTLVAQHFPEIEVEYVERDRLRPFRGTLSMDKARDLIGHVPRVELEEGLRRYVEWYQELTSKPAEPVLS
jgi:nucleoside-diphosphate-sugar epimerase